MFEIRDIRKNYPSIDFEFKKSVLTQKDMLYYNLNEYNNNENEDNENTTIVSILNEIKEISSKCFSNTSLDIIKIPKSVTKLESDFFQNCLVKELILSSNTFIIPKLCLLYCSQLTNLILPLNETRMLWGNKIFNNHSDLNISFYSLVACLISDEKPDVVIILFPL